MAPRKVTPTVQELGPITENHLVKNRQDLGRFGSLIGSKENAPVYFAGMVALLGMISILCASLSPWAADAARADVIKTMAGIVLAALTFLGGAYASTKRE